MFLEDSGAPFAEHPLFFQIDQGLRSLRVAAVRGDAEPTSGFVHVPRAFIAAHAVPVHATERGGRVRDAQLYRLLVPTFRGGHVLSNPARGLERRSAHVEQGGELRRRRGVTRGGSLSEPFSRPTGARAAFGAVTLEPRASQVVRRLGDPRLRRLRVGLHRGRSLGSAYDAEAVHEAVPEVECGARVASLGGEPEGLRRVPEVLLRARSGGAADTPPVRALQRAGFRAASEPVRTFPRILRGAAVAVHVYLTEQLHRLRVLLRHDFVALHGFLLVLRDAVALAVAGGHVDEREGMTGSAGTLEPLEGGGVVAGKLDALVVGGAQVAHRLRIAKLSLLAQCPHRMTPDYQ